MVVGMDLEPNFFHALRGRLSSESLVNCVLTPNSLAKNRMTLTNARLAACTAETGMSSKRNPSLKL